MNSEILVKFKGDTKDLESSTNKAQSSVNSLSSGLSKGLGVAAGIAATAIATATAAVVGLTKACWNGVNATAQYGDEIDKNSQKVGLSKEAYQQWDYVMQIAGTSMKDCSVGMKTLTNKVDDAKNGGKGAVDIFNKLGISVDDLKGKSREDIFSMTVASLQNVKDETEKAALANDLFGKSGQNLMPMFNATNEETQKLIEETKTYGMIMGDDAVSASAAFQDSLTKLRKTGSGLKNKFFGIMIPGITDIIDGFSDMVAGVDGGEEKMQQGIENIANKFSEALPKIIDTITRMIPTLVEAAGKIILAIVQGLIQSLPQIIPAVMQIMMQIRTTLLQMLPELLKCGLEMIVELAKGIIQSLPELIPAVLEILFEMVGTLLENIDMLIDVAIDLIIAISEGIINALPIIIEKAPEITIALVKGIIKSLPKLATAAVRIIGSLVQSLGENIWKVIEWALGIPGRIRDAIVEGIQEIKNAGGRCMEGLVDGLKDKWNNLKGGVKSLGEGIVNKFKDVFGIHSPSKEFAFIGKMNMEGLEQGMKDMQPEIQKTIDGAFDLSPQLVGTANTHLSPNINVVVNNDIRQDPLGQMVQNIKTFSGGSKNDYNYGMGR